MEQHRRKRRAKISSRNAERIAETVAQKTQQRWRTGVAGKAKHCNAHRNEIEYTRGVQVLRSPNFFLGNGSR